MCLKLGSFKYCCYNECSAVHAMLNCSCLYYISLSTLSQKSETVAVVSPFSATVSRFCDSVHGQGFSYMTLYLPLKLNDS